jgi:hypothetical protein
MAREILTDVNIDGDLDITGDAVVGGNAAITGDLTVQGTDILDAILDAEILLWMGL